jgi:putative addiction module component (TIGR02574 family)
VTSDPQAVFDAALALPDQERAALAQLLLESLSEQGDETGEEELLAELDRRRAEAQGNPGDAVPWSQLRDEQ